MVFWVHSSNMSSTHNRNAILKRRGGMTMSGIKVGENENIDSALRRFKRETAKSGVMAEIKKRKHYEKPQQSWQAFKILQCAIYHSSKPKLMLISAK